MNIAQRLWVMMVTSIVALLLVGGAGLLVVNSMNHALETANQDTLPSINIIDDAEMGLLALRVRVLQHIMNTQADKMEAIEVELKKQESKLRDSLGSYNKLISDAEDARLYEIDKQAVNAYLQKMPEVLNYSRQNMNDMARDLLNSELAPLGEKAYEALEVHAKYSQDFAERTEKSAQSTVFWGNLISGLVIVLGVLCVGGLGLFLRKNIGDALQEMQGTVVKIQRDLDFTLRIPVRRQDELGRTAVALNQLLAQLQDNLRSLAESAYSVKDASGLMAETSSQVATASTQQSAAASNMAATVEEMTVSINHVGDRALEANQLSQRSSQLAVTGGDVIRKTVADINGIAETVNTASAHISELEVQSDRISSVVSVIKEVADQTNLLALNAAIEAARAGEQGRGFAVVADEVRKLAERTASSTQEIASMIESVRNSAKTAVVSMTQTVERVGEGVVQASNANAAIVEIGDGSEQTMGMVSEITAAIREQSSASNNIAVQVEKIAHMAEESSAAAEETASSATRLDALATKMQGIIAAYRL